MPEQLEQAPDLGRLAAGDTQHAPPHLDRDVWHHPEDVCARKGGADALQRGGAEQGDERLRELAELGGRVAQPRRLDREDDDVGRLGQLSVRGDRPAADLDRERGRPA